MKLLKKKVLKRPAMLKRPAVVVAGKAQAEDDGGEPPKNIDNSKKRHTLQTHNLNILVQTYNPNIILQT